MRRRELGSAVLAMVVFVLPASAGAQALPPNQDLSAQALGTVNDVVGEADQSVGQIVDTVDQTAETGNQTVGQAVDTVDQAVEAANQATSQASGSVTQAVAAATSAPAAGAQEVTDTDSNTVASSPSPSGSGDAVSGGSSAQTTGAGANRSASASREASARAKPGRTYRSRFDRLPRRLELILERIELGRDVGANVRRLRAALRDSPALRARVLRLLRAELRRLRAHGVTSAERPRIKRLQLVERSLTPARRAVGQVAPSRGVAVVHSQGLQAQSPAGAHGTFGAVAESEDPRDIPAGPSISIPIPPTHGGGLPLWGTVLGLLALVLAGLASAGFWIRIAILRRTEPS